MKSVIFGLVMGLVLASVVPAGAASDVYVRAGGQFKPVTIAVTPMAGDNAKVGAVIANDMARSIFLSPINPSTFPEKPANPDVAPNLDAWRTVNAQFVLTGRIENGGGGRLTARFRLWDVATGEQIAGEQFSGDAASSRRIAHLISDKIFARVTGEKGFFDSRVVFVDETGPKTRRIKRIALMDMDGANVKYLTNGDKLVVTPAFSPNDQQIAYMAFGAGEPSVTVMNLESGQRQTLGNFSNMSFAPRFSPDGRHIVMSLSDGANASLYEMDLGSHETRRLTNAGAIDTSPSYSPDASQIVFESDRGGHQQLYVMSAGGGDAKRISFGEGRYSTPVWSPKGDLIAFTRQDKGEFGIGVMKPDGSDERMITEGFHNEGPTFSPNGLFVMFFRDPGGAGGAHIYMADVFGHGEFQVPTPSYASDPSWGPLLK
jgi:TolB protein